MSPQPGTQGLVLPPQAIPLGSRQQEYPSLLGHYDLTCLSPVSPQMETLLLPTILVAQEKHIRGSTSRNPKVTPPPPAPSQNSYLPVTGHLCVETGNEGGGNTPVTTQFCEHQQGDMQSNATARNATQITDKRAQSG